MKTAFLLMSLLICNYSFSNECTIKSDANTVKQVDELIADINQMCLTQLQDGRANIQCLNTFTLPLMMNHVALIEAFPAVKKLNDEIGTDLFGQYIYFENIEKKLGLNHSSDTTYSEAEFRQIVEATLCDDGQTSWLPQFFNDK